MTKNFRFTTNLNCGGCVSTVTPYLEKISGILSWTADTSMPEKILTVRAENTEAETIENAVREAGFKISLLETN